MNARRVAITGIGVVSPIGNSATELWSGALAGRSAVRHITRFDPSPFRSRIAAEIDEIPIVCGASTKRARRLDRFSKLAVAAGLQAWNDAGIRACPGDLRDRIGVSLGSALGGVASAEDEHTDFVHQGVRSVSPSLALSVFGAAGSTNLAMELGLHGPNTTNSNSCASGAVAIGDAMAHIRSGRADIMLAGGVEAPLAPLTFGAFSVIRALSERNDDPEHASRPFDRDRDGFVMAEGAAVLVLEEWDRAAHRGAHVYAELVGYATTNDAYHMTVPRPDGAQARQCMERALVDAHLTVQDVSLVSAHASSTMLGDRAEACALEQLFGDCRPVVFATKGAHGHALGATPAIETAILALALQHQCAPRTVNLGHRDVDCHLSLTDSATRVSARYALKNAFGFGGINACLVLAASNRGP